MEIEHKIWIIFCLVVCSLVMFSCTSARWASLKALGSKHKVQLYSGGKKIGEWVSSGVVANQDNSDGYHFQDDATGLNVEIGGTVIITQE